MTITSSGVVCDVCGEYILLEDCFAFSVRGCKTEMHCHEGCKPVLIAAKDDWHKLPAGPLRRAFEVAHGEAGE